MKCPRCAGKDLVVREWQIEWYDAHYFEGEVTDVKHRETSDSGFEENCAAECCSPKCGYSGKASEFREVADPPFSVPVVFTSNPSTWKTRLARWLMS